MSRSQLTFLGIVVGILIIGIGFWMYISNKESTVSMLEDFETTEHAASVNPELKADTGTSTNNASTTISASTTPTTTIPITTATSSA